jgi:gliding motility-associated-like protein
LTVTSSNGCSASDTYEDYIEVESVPNAAFTASENPVSMMDPQVHFINNSTGAVNYLWNFPYDGSSTTEFEPTHVFPNEEPGSYIVELIAYSEKYGCTDTAWMTIIVEEELIFYVPNTFTPDDDKYNELFYPVFYSGYDPYDYTMYIFNRWGQIIWESHDASVGWDGTYGGNTVQDGTYTWTMEFKTTMNDERVRYNGHVNVIR